MSGLYDTVGRFLVLKDFIIRREADRCVLNEGNSPVLGHYLEGHDYGLTPLNAPCVYQAIEQGLARITVEPKDGDLPT